MTLKEKYLQGVVRAYRLSEKRYYTSGYNEEEGYIYIDHIEPWGGSRRSENVEKVDVKGLDEKTIKLLYETIGITIQILQQHTEEINEYYSGPIPDDLDI